MSHYRRYGWADEKDFIDEYLTSTHKLKRYIESLELREKDCDWKPEAFKYAKKRLKAFLDYEQGIGSLDHKRRKKHGLHEMP